MQELRPFLPVPSRKKATQAAPGAVFTTSRDARIPEQLQQQHRSVTVTATSVRLSKHFPTEPPYLLEVAVHVWVVIFQ